MSQVSQTAIQAARKADLYAFLLKHHSNGVKVEGSSLRLLDDPSVTLKEGFSGWKDWSSGATGNAIEFLTEYLSYDFTDAVIALCTDMGVDPYTQSVSQSQPAPALTLPDSIGSNSLPRPELGPYRRLFAYLMEQRKIPQDVIQMLIDREILYQEADHGNLVFINPDRSHAEIRGTNTFKPFHQVLFSDPTSFWWFKSGDSMFADASIAFVCEAAIDAISLYLLLREQLGNETALFCSISGVANQQRIDFIKSNMSAAGCHTIIAVDNDNAGTSCRARNQDCQVMIPVNKDWNEDWIAAVSR